LRACLLILIHRHFLLLCSLYHITKYDITKSSVFYHLMNNWREIWIFLWRGLKSTVGHEKLIYFCGDYCYRTREFVLLVWITKNVVWYCHVICLPVPIIYFKFVKLFSILVFFFFLLIINMNDEDENVVQWLIEEFLSDNEHWCGKFRQWLIWIW